LLKGAYYVDVYTSSDHKTCQHKWTKSFKFPW